MNKKATLEELSSYNDKEKELSLQTAPIFANSRTKYQKVRENKVQVSLFLRGETRGRTKVVARTDDIARAELEAAAVEAEDRSLREDITAVR